MLINMARSPMTVERPCGVVHVDDTSRPQMVASPGPYYNLLTHMEMLSGIEAVICTSFNQAGEPMVYRLVDVRRSAKTMSLDAFAGDGWLVRL
jgi:carbamoyltransferase